MGHLLRETDENFDKSSTLAPDIPHPRLNPIRRVGAPRHNWITETMNQIWEEHTQEIVQLGEPETVFDKTKRSHIQAINVLAHTRQF